VRSRSRGCVAPTCYLDVNKCAKLGPRDAECVKDSRNGRERRVFCGLFDLLYVRSIHAGARGQRFLRKMVLEAEAAEREGEWAWSVWAGIEW
jgi:hypothetical protein